MRGPLAALGSLPLSLGAVALLLVAVLSLSFTTFDPTWVLLGPMVLLLVNLAAAIATSPRFRKSLPLLVFHLALAALLPLAAFSRLTYFKGMTELGVGESFSGHFVHVEQGPWHVLDLGEGAFTNLGFTVDYFPGRTRKKTTNQIRVRGDEGREIFIGDGETVEVNGYRLKTATHYGFSLLFAWHAEGGGAPYPGRVNLPSLPVDAGSSNHFDLPDGRGSVLVNLVLPRPALDEGQSFRFGAEMPAHHLTVTAAGRTLDLLPGEGMDLPGGRLVYGGMRTWMGYMIHYDAARPWMLAASLLAVAALLWHFIARFTSTPWLSTTPAPDAPHGK